MNPIKQLLTALGFLTRLAPAKLVDHTAISSCMRWLPAVGLVLGLAVVAPFWWLGLFEGRPLVQAWVAVCLNLYLTRGLHLDGLSDVADGCASHTETERFWSIVKDSRIGAFGAVSMILALGGQVVLFSELLRADLFGGMVWCFVAGRGAAVVLGFVVRSLARPGLGQRFMDGAGPASMLFAVLFTLAAGLLLTSALGVVLAVGVVFVALIPLYYLVYTVEGVNGDFLGACIVIGEVAAALGLLLLA
ncbi:cobalamin-5'-phosphate synthase [Paucidesulfovibrio gracilis DSM 16080]|uniref:Adenosylcobinamide-GDP ribazoletransferase n=1 Tax=Paucidesulfovibrio gracilis DSM 16080 TaxID=1121449 RepID=A0A1T4Y648_9BACT|nr:adenosylcobinamide-GDP ribazoletransferase [Paucidesulfovibrio gracilis]SKA97133.1 cobalamin-5'-phosphate synthase [Paucidesulfovibrio gracilis DSM 16080]